MFQLEICAGSLVSAMNAQQGGAHRVELCDNLNEGGTTPSAGTIILAKKMLKIPVFVLIRPRPGDFLYSGAEIEIMKEDILFCKEQGAEGVVFGILNKDGNVDIERVGQLVSLARPMQVTFHRAFDVTADPFQAMEEIIMLGFERILTSGQSASAPEGTGLISDLIKAFENQIVILPGGGINENNVIELLEKTGAGEVHASLRSETGSAMSYRKKAVSMGKHNNDEYFRMETDLIRVQKLIEKLETCWKKLYE